MTAKILYSLTLFWILAFASCNKATPAGFWKNYKNNLLVENISDQGPYGGHRAMYWKADNTNTFNSSNLLEFAKKNGWTFVDSSVYNQEQTTKWVYSDEPVFPLTSTGFSDLFSNDSRLTDFPRWFSGQLTVYKFKTGWITIEPGTDNSIEENGFVVINKDKTEMAVYHLWGE